MRKHNLSTHLISNSNDDDDSCRKDCTFENNPLNLSTTNPNIKYEFISSKWVSCTAEYGGGIYLKAGSTVSLSITNGEFYSCKSSYRGGGIYVGGIGKLKVTTTLFSGCVAEAKADYGGGGINNDAAQEVPSIECSSFISCTSGNDGGGVAIWDSPSFQKVCLTDSRFVECKGLASTGSDGGSLIVWFSNAAIGCSNTLFVDSHSDQRGGAVSQYIYSSAKHTPSIRLFYFCFFKNNSARINPGNDVYFEDWKPTQPFLYCFSLTQTNRVYFSGTHDDWLPLGTLSSLNLRRERESAPS